MSESPTIENHKALNMGKTGDITKFHKGVKLTDETYSLNEHSI